jgi:hypothetical protein
MKYTSAVAAVFSLVSLASAGVIDFLECQLCESVKPEGTIKDCSCEYNTVDTAVNDYFIPVLKNLTSKTYFRYFRVDLDKECPFWNDMGKIISM